MKKAKVVKQEENSGDLVQNAPRPGFTTTAVVTKVHDGDTWEVELRRRFYVRIMHPNSKLEFNTPEQFTKEGQKVTKKIQELFEGKEVLIFIPAGRSELNLLDITSFSRLLGEIYLDNNSVTDIMLNDKMGKLYKPGTYKTTRKAIAKGKEPGGIS